MNVLGATSSEGAAAFIEIGGVVIVLAVLARLAGRLGISAIPFYLVAGLAVGEGGVVSLDVSAEFISLIAEIGVLLLLLSLGLQYTSSELRQGLRTGIVPGVVDGLANFTPGFLVGLVLGWGVAGAVLLGGVVWVSSSGIVAKVLTDLDRLGNRETPAILNLLVIEDLAMAFYLPIAAAIVLGRGALATAVTVAVALLTAMLILAFALRFGVRLSRSLEGGSDEALLLAVFGLTLLVAGLAQRLEVSAAIGAFLVGLALSGPAQHRAEALMGPLRDLFAAVFFLSFSLQIRPAAVLDALVPASALVVLAVGGKLLSGWVAGRSVGVSTPGRIRAGTALIARGEFSVVIASLGGTLAVAGDLAGVAAAFVLLTAIIGPIAARFADRVGVPRPASPAPAAAPSSRELP